jgi:hypothetical protein
VAGDQADRRASTRILRLPAPDELLDDGDDEQRVAVCPLVNEGSKALAVVADAPLKIFANVRG